MINIVLRRENNIILETSLLNFVNIGFFRESNLQQCVKTVYGESATTSGLPQLSPQVTVYIFTWQLPRSPQHPCFYRLFATGLIFARPAGEKHCSYGPGTLRANFKKLFKNNFSLQG